MENDDWRRIARWTGYVYLPIALLIIGIFILIQWNARHIDAQARVLGNPSAASSTPGY